MDYGTEQGDYLGELGPAVVALSPGLASAGTTFVFPRSERWRVRAVSFTLTTAAGGGARQVFAELHDPAGNPVFAVAAPATQAGGLTVRYSFANGVQAGGTAALGRLIESFFDGWLPDNISLVVVVTGTAAADQLSAGTVLVDQWPIRPGQ